MRNWGAANRNYPLVHKIVPLLSCKICANALINKKDTQEWMPLKCLISKLLNFVAGPRIELGTS